MFCTYYFKYFYYFYICIVFLWVLLFIQTLVATLLDFTGANDITQELSPLMNISKTKIKTVEID